jgi:hypothetical protein
LDAASELRETGEVRREECESEVAAGRAGRRSRVADLVVRRALARASPSVRAAKRGQSELHDKIRAVLQGSAEPMKLLDIAQKVKANGYNTKSKNFGVILGLRLSEMADVKRVERGVYSMK